MKAKDMIDALNKIVEQHGNKDVYYLDEYDHWHSIRCIRIHEEEDAIVCDQLPH